MREVPFVPTLGALFWYRSSSTGALGGMLAGGILAVLIQTVFLHLPGGLARLGINSSLYGILISELVFVPGSLLFPDVPNEG